MKLNRKAIVAAAIIASAASFSAPSAFAAGADSFSDVPKDHWAYEALDYLAKEGVVDGYTDGTFEGNRTMSRYEMAAIVYKACQNENISIGGRAVLDKLRAEYDAEIKQLNTRVDKVEKDVEEMQKFGVHGVFRAQYDVDANKGGNTNVGGNANDNKRFWMELQGFYKVNDNWTARYQQEYNARYTDDSRSAYVDYDNDNKVVGDPAADAIGSSQGVQRLWVEGQADNGNWVNIGRAWRGLGFQNQFIGTETDGIQAGINLGGLQASPFVLRNTNTTRTNSATAYGLQIQGPVGHNFDITAAYARVSSEDAVKDGNGYNVGFATNVAKNLRLIAEYQRINNDTEMNGASWEARVNYKGTDLQDKGSFGMFARYLKTGEIRGLMNSGDDEWGSLDKNTRMWILGASYVPAKNIEWTTLVEFGKRGIHTGDTTTRNMFRTQVDFHF